jgi:AbrB family looped-hinge helix DNA binding protein
MRMTSKGQVTIPADIRKQFGLGPGQEVEVVAGDDGAVVRAVRQSAGRGADLVARLRDRADGELTAEAVLRLTRGDG